MNSILVRLVVPASILIGAAVGAAQPPKVAVPEGVVFERDVEYANPDGQHLKLNLARPKDGAGPFPAVVCIHGGGFRAGNREGYNGTVLKLAQNGYVAVTVTYRLAPKYQFPAAVHDTKAAVRWLRANATKYHIDPDRIGVTGGSAGGHLAQFLGVTGDVQGVRGRRRQPRPVQPGRLRRQLLRPERLHQVATARAWTPPRCCRCCSAAT